MALKPLPKKKSFLLNNVRSLSVILTIMNLLVKYIFILTMQENDQQNNKLRNPHHFWSEKSPKIVSRPTNSMS